MSVKGFFKDFFGVIPVEKTESSVAVAEAPVIRDQKVMDAIDDLAKKKAEVARLRDEVRRLTAPEVVENIAPNDPLHVAVTKVTPVVPCNPWNVASELRKLYAYRKGLSAMERAAVDAVSERILALEYRIRDSKFQRLDMNWIMKQRTKEGWPAFAVFAPDNPDCWIEHQENRGRGGGFFSPSSREEGKHFPSLYLNPAYDDVRKRLEKVVNEYFEDDSSRICARISCGWTGVLPERIRQRIKECSPKQKWDVAKKKMVSEPVVGSSYFNVSIVMEAPAWKLDTRVIPVNMDPLVVGAFGDQFWLLDIFDVTPLERIAASEFAEWKK